MVETVQQTQSPAGADGQTSGTAAQVSGAGSQSTQTTPPTRPEWLPETYWDATSSAPKGADIASAFKERDELKSAAAAIKAAIPPSADQYKLEIPKEIALPADIELKADDPLIAELRTAAFDAGLPQDKFSNMLGKLAAKVGELKKAEQSALADAVKKRDEALGANGPARVQAVQDFFKTLTADPSEQMQLNQILWTPAIVANMEKLALAVKNAGLSFSGKGREGERPDGRPNGWDTMSPLDRRTWDLMNQQQR